jgi:hypothetical protein
MPTEPALPATASPCRVSGKVNPDIPEFTCGAYAEPITAATLLTPLVDLFDVWNEKPCFGKK